MALLYLGALCHRGETISRNPLGLSESYNAFLENRSDTYFWRVRVYIPDSNHNDNNLHPRVFSTFISKTRKSYQKNRIAKKPEKKGEKITKGKKVIFRSKTSWQKDDCINRTAKYDCPNKSTLEAVCGKSMVRCCENKKCKEIAAKIARSFRS